MYNNEKEAAQENTLPLPSFANLRSKQQHEAAIHRVGS